MSITVTRERERLGSAGLSEMATWDGSGVRSEIECLTIGCSQLSFQLVHARNALLTSKAQFTHEQTITKHRLFPVIEVDHGDPWQGFSTSLSFLSQLGTRLAAAIGSYPPARLNFFGGSPFTGKTKSINLELAGHDWILTYRFQSETFNAFPLG